MDSIERNVPLLGRILLATIFLVSGFDKLFHFAATSALLDTYGIPASNAMLVGALVIELAGGLALLAGYYVRIAALVLAFYLIPVTVIFHGFWGAAPGVSHAQLINFLKNLAIMGGLLYVAVYGAGGRSVDASDEARHKRAGNEQTGNRPADGKEEKHGRDEHRPPPERGPARA